MTKKEILVSLLIFIVVVGVSAGTYVVWTHYRAWQISVQKTANATTEVVPSDSISLSSTDTDANSLKVDASANSSNPAQLGSGQTNTGTNTGANSSASAGTAPGPETFGQYDKYKDDQAALFADLQVGTGAEAKQATKVAILYKGWLTNGTLFDQSRTDDNGKLKAFSFTVGQHEVISGMEQDIVGMKVGGTRRMIIPPAVGYGATAKDTIPANSVLVFDVQLVAVE